MTGLVVRESRYEYQQPRTTLLTFFHNTVHVPPQRCVTKAEKSGRVQNMRRVCVAREVAHLFFANRLRAARSTAGGSQDGFYFFHPLPKLATGAVLCIASLHISYFSSFAARIQAIEADYPMTPLPPPPSPSHPPGIFDEPHTASVWRKNARGMTINIKSSCVSSLRSAGWAVESPGTSPRLGCAKFAATEYI